LFSVDVNGKLLIWDLRPARRRPLTVLDGLEKKIYEICDATTDVARLQSSLGSEQPIAASLESLVADGLMARDRSLFLSLAVPLGTYKPESRVVEKFYDLVSRLGRRNRHSLVVPLAPRSAAPRSSAASPSGRSRNRSLSSQQFSINGDGDLVISMTTTSA
jgi:hypothetical protein